MLGSALIRSLRRTGYSNIITRTSHELDLRRQEEVEQFFMEQRPEVVMLAAAKVGGILANNTYRADFIYDNLAIETNVIRSAWQAGVNRLIFFSSSCVYPRNTVQPMKEDNLWTGTLEPTNEPYAVAKLAGMSMCRAFNQQYGTKYFTVVPTNLYGKNDNYHPEHSHVVGALIRKFHQAKIQKQSSVELWGSGTPRREFLYVDDAANAVVYLMENYSDDSPVNVGFGSDITINELAVIISQIIGFTGDIHYDSSKPDGVPRKLLDSSRVFNLGWKPLISLRDGLKYAYEDFLKTYQF